MAEKHFSRRNLDFTLLEVLNVESLTQFEYFNAHDRETFAMVLDASADIAEKIMKPAFVDSDRNQPELIDGKVKVHQGVHDYFKAFSETGLLAASFPFEFGGQRAGWPYPTNLRRPAHALRDDLQGPSEDRKAALDR